MKILKYSFKKQTHQKSKRRVFRRGMTYIELIVVLSIFALMSSVIVFNYKDFEKKVDMNNLANDIALKFVEAEKASLSGRIPGVLPEVFPWKPSYGIYFDLTESPTALIYFADLDQNKFFDVTDISPGYDGCLGGECVDFVKINKGNFISGIYALTSGSGGTENETDVSGERVQFTFTRPSSSATFKCTSCSQSTNGLKIKTSSPDGPGPTISVYASGRIQIN